LLIERSSGRRVYALEWFIELAFFGVVLAYSVYCIVLAARPAERMLVTSEGILYRGLRRTHRIAWSEVLRARWDLFRRNSRLHLTVREPAKPRKVVLDLEGVSPSRMEFVRQMFHFAPATLGMEKLKLKLGPPPGPSPDFELMRADAREVATGKDLDDLLAAADDLERLWKPFLDSKEKKR
jgi:hypothetical protein